MNTVLSCTRLIVIWNKYNADLCFENIVFSWSFKKALDFLMTLRQDSLLSKSPWNHPVQDRESAQIKEHLRDMEGPPSNANRICG